MRALSEADSRAGNQRLVYRLDVRTKILVCLSMSVAVIFLKSPQALGFLTIISLAYALNLGRYKVVLICYAAVCLMWLVSIGIMRLMHMVVPLIPVTEPARMLIPFLRTLAMLNTVLALALSSRVQTLLTSLKSFRLPVWLYIPSAVMVRFIPSFIKDVQQIHETMRIRGYSLNPLFILCHPVTAVRLMAAPVIFRALRSSDDLGVAAELKGVGYGAAMENYNPLSFNRTDALALAVALAVLAGAWMIQGFWGADTAGVFP
ncbi:MAG: energy-coupling factor transporter transmembrane protein EcfT [Desulfobacterales bacterium]|nr:energy-coupling factor transporter transmembrane protein EcfT [Desulfobacterales bacterium]